MATLLNNPNCESDVGATGVPSCFIDPRIVVGAILVDPAKTFDQDDIDDLKTVLQTATLADGSARVFPVFRFVEVNDATEDVTIQTYGYGAKQWTKEGKYDWTFRFMDGGLCLNENLRKFNDRKMKVLFIDEANRIYGTLNADDALTGFSCDMIYTYPFKLTDGSGPNSYRIRFVLTKPEEWDNKGVYFADFDVEEEVKGLLELEVYLIDNATPNQVTVGVRTNCDKVDLYTTYDDDLADAALWAIEDADGVAIVPDSVVKDDTTEGWVISFTEAGIVDINLTTPSLLAAAGIGGAPGNGYVGKVLEVDMAGS